MALPKAWIESVGSWKGTYRLNQSWLPPGKQVSESESHLHIEVDHSHSFATITYSWEFEGKRQEGVLVVAASLKAKSVEAGWSDSWHESTAVMHVTGTMADQGPSKLVGTYKAEVQEWGWTITLDLSNAKAEISMENVPPGGKPVWAVASTYSRQ